MLPDSITIDTSDGDSNDGALVIAVLILGASMFCLLILKVFGKI